MNVKSACLLIEQHRCFYGWKLTPKDNTSRFEGGVLVEVEYTARKTEREDVVSGSEDEFLAHASFTIQVDDRDTEETLAYKVMFELVRTMVHELRESYRVGPTLWAPYHPHRKDGMRRWARTPLGKLFGGEHGDRTFGLA